MRQRYELPTRAAGLAAAALATLAISHCTTPDTSPPDQGATFSTSHAAPDSPALAGDAGTKPGSIEPTGSQSASEVVPPSRAPSRFKEAPIGAVGHGALITPDGDVVSKPTRQFIRDAQAYYIERLLREARPSVREEFEAREQDADQSEIARNAADFSWLLDNVRPADEALLASFNQFLALKGGAEEATGYDREPYFIATENGGSEYVKECERNGVPIPPEWGSDKWHYRGVQDPVLISQEYTANVYVYDENPLGVCYALPRSDETGMIWLFGVICQGNESNKACFWDNGMKVLDPKKVKSLTDGDFIGGADLKKGLDVCTDCHRGQNVFIVHPDTPLDLAWEGGIDQRSREGLQSQYANAWVQPLVLPHWPQNPEPRRLLEDIAVDGKAIPPEGSCVSCHSEFGGMRLAELSGGYCLSVIVPMIDRKLMPPPKWVAALVAENRPVPVFDEHNNAIRTACAGAVKARNAPRPGLDEDPGKGADDPPPFTD